MPFKSDSVPDGNPFNASDSNNDSPNIIQQLFKLESNVSWANSAKQSEGELKWLNFDPIQTESATVTNAFKPIIRDDEKSPEYVEALRKSSALVAEKVDRSGVRSFTVDEKGMEKQGFVVGKSDMQTSTFEEIDRLNRGTQQRSINMDGHIDKGMPHQQQWHENKPLHLEVKPHHPDIQQLVHQMHEHKPHVHLHLLPHQQHQTFPFHYGHLTPMKPLHDGGQNGHHHTPEEQMVPGGGVHHPHGDSGNHHPHGDNGSHHPSESYPASADIGVANQRFDSAVEKLSPAMQEKFNRSRAELISGCHERGLSEREITNTLDQVTRLLETESKVLDPKYDEKARMIGALGILRNSTQPDYYCNQGHHKTCNVTTVEERSFNNNPSRAAQIVADSLLNGEFTSLDGKVIKLDPDALRPDAEAKQNRLDGANSRSYASQIFQAAVLTDLGSRHEPPVVYIANGGPNPSGEGWFDPQSGKKVSFTGANLKEVEQMNHSVNGDSNVVKGDFKSPADLENWINTNEAKQPLILCVDGKDPLFQNHQTSDGKLSRPNHVVSIREYDSINHRVRVSNQWGSKADFWVDVNTLYQAT